MTAVPYRHPSGAPDRKNQRRSVDVTGPEAPGTIVVDPAAHFRYLVMENGPAMRYGVGVGQAGLEFTGEGIIERKADWPR